MAYDKRKCAEALIAAVAGTLAGIRQNDRANSLTLQDYAPGLQQLITAANGDKTGLDRLGHCNLRGQFVPRFELTCHDGISYRVGNATVNGARIILGYLYFVHALPLNRFGISHSQLDASA